MHSLWNVSAMTTNSPRTTENTATVPVLHSLNAYVDLLVKQRRGASTQNKMSTFRRQIPSSWKPVACAPTFTICLSEMKWSIKNYRKVRSAERRGHSLLQGSTYGLVIHYQIVSLTDILLHKRSQTPNCVLLLLLIWHFQRGKINLPRMA